MVSLPLVMAAPAYALRAEETGSRSDKGEFTASRVTERLAQTHDPAQSSKAKASDLPCLVTAISVNLDNLPNRVASRIQNMSLSRTFHLQTLTS